MQLQRSQRLCFDVYLVQFEQEIGSGESALAEPEVIESDWIFPTVDDNGTLTLNVTTNSLSPNTFYNATLITAMDMTEAGSIQFCECIITCM